MTKSPYEGLQVVAIGEILYDVVGNQQHLGGAPYNFVHHARNLGADAYIISRIGQDDLGAGVERRLDDAGISSAFLQIDTAHPTGTVQVTVDQQGQPEYDIQHGSAWDNMEFLDKDRDLIDRANVFYFGSLAQRTATARASIQAAISAAPLDTLRVFDINLRSPHYELQTLLTGLDNCDLLKLNEGEVGVLRDLLKLPAQEAEAVNALMANHPMEIVVLTRGAAGASAYTKDSIFNASGIPVAVTDTIGSGDAFTAMFALALADGEDVEEALALANAAGAYVASQAGATPPMDLETLRKLNHQ